MLKTPLPPPKENDRLSVQQIVEIAPERRGCFVNTIANFDPEIVPLLDQPVPVDLQPAAAGQPLKCLYRRPEERQKPIPFRRRMTG